MTHAVDPTRATTDLAEIGLSRRGAIGVIAAAAAGASALGAPKDAPTTRAWRAIDPKAFPGGIPATPREFRGAWVATVDNIDWPSAKTISSRQQQDELRRLVATAASLNLNTIVLQVRPSCDAIYPSAIEPWSEFLTGRSGRAPNPDYDPLALWIDEAHRRGILVHAWINPFRARHHKAQFPDAPSHISRTHPALVRKYDNLLWLDPGEPLVHDRALQVVRDLLTRYDLDGIHIDDYFYPYPKPNLPFDDERSWKRASAGNPALARDDWRRDNVNRFVERLYREVHEVRREALVGISPFGIWRPGFPPGVKSMDPYTKIFADSRLWLREGWLDYCAPQLYWARDARDQPFEPLLDWWLAENSRARHLMPGLYASRVGGKEGPSWKPAEITGQIASMRARPACAGHLLFSMNVLNENRERLNDALLQSCYQAPALVAPTTWLGGSPPRSPALHAEVAGTQDSAAVLRLTWNPGSAADVFRWVLWARYGSTWTMAIRPGNERTMNLLDRGKGGTLNALALAAADRLGQESSRVALVPSEA